jgi:pimeloyl-ACP methyl ester carboxylesterase
VKPRSYAIIAALLFATGFLLWTPDKTRADLETTYVRSRRDLIDVAGVRLHVRDTGPRSAPVLVMLHGFGSSLHTWEPWADSLQRDFRVVRFDLPGSGLSSIDPTGDYRDARSMQVLTALLDTLHIARATLVGNSMGGRIAWSYAAAHPDRVERLVLISPDGFASPGFEYGKAPEVPVTMTLMRYVLPKPLLTMSLEPAYADPKAMTDALARRYYDLMLVPGAREAMLERMHQTVLSDPVPILRTIHAPTLLLWGQQDQMIPFKNAADYVKALPNATLVPLPGLGHLPFEEAPARSIAPLRAFLDRTSTIVAGI